MIDSQTQSKTRVSSDGTAGPYLMVRLDQLSRVRAILDQQKIQYWVDSDAISLNGKPAIVIVNFGRSEDAKRIQTVLDQAS
jgi:hypothetical protein